MKNTLVGIQRSQFNDSKTGEVIHMTDCYVMTEGAKLDGLEGNTCARYRLMRMEKPELKPGDVVQILTMPDGKGGVKVQDVYKA